MTTSSLSRLSRLIMSAAAALLLMGGGSQLHAQTVAVMVNGEPITAYDIDQRNKLNVLSHKAATRQQVIDELIDEKVKIKEAKKFGVDPSASDIDSAFAQMSSRMRTTPDQLTKIARSPGHPRRKRSRPASRRTWSGAAWCAAGSRRACRSAKRTSPRAVEVNADDKDKPQTESFEYQMRPIVLIVPRGAAPAAIEIRRKEAEALRARVQSCDEANRSFQIHAECRDTRHR